MESKSFEDFFTVQELSKLFAGFEDKIGANSWKIEENTPCDPTIEKEATLRHGLARIDFLRDKNYSTVIWDAVIPEYLKPGHQNAADFVNFQKFIFCKLPKMLGYKYLLTTENQLVNRYIDGSKFQLITKKDEEKEYPLSDREKYLQFVIDFTKNPSDISFLYLKAQPQSSNFFESGFHLTLSYNQTEGEKICLAVPLRLNSTPWNTNMTTYMLETHKQNYQIDNLDKAAEDLSKYLLEESKYKQTPL